MNQQQAILKHFKQSNTLTACQASTDLGITQLSARLIELQSMGHKFSMVWERGLNRLGNNSKWVVYRYLGVK